MFLIRPKTIAPVTRLTGVVTGYRGHRRCCWVSVTHSAGLTTYHLGTFDCLYRAAAIFDRHFWRACVVVSGQNHCSGCSQALAVLTVAAFALTQSAETSLQGDLLMVAAIVLCGLGYAEGAVLSRRLGGWQVISWALVFSLPFMIVLALASLPETWAGVSLSAWAALGYVSVFSMLIGFVFWYRGLAIGGIRRRGSIAAIAAILWPHARRGFLLREPIEVSMIGVTLFVVLCVTAQNGSHEAVSNPRWPTIRVI